MTAYPHLGYKIGLAQTGEHTQSLDLDIPKYENVDRLLWRLAKAYGSRNDGDFNKALSRLNDLCGNLRCAPCVSTEGQKVTVIKNWYSEDGHKLAELDPYSEGYRRLDTSSITATVVNK